MIKYKYSDPAKEAHEFGQYEQMKLGLKRYDPAHEARLEMIFGNNN